MAIFNHVATSFPLDAIVVDEENPEKLKETIKLIYLNLRPFSQGIQKSRRFPDDPLVQDMDFDRNLADQSDYFAIITEFLISRKGGFTCPVKSLFVFISSEYVDILDFRLKNFNDIKTYENLLGLAENCPEVPFPTEKITKTGFEYCEFKSSNQNLKPVLWVNFLTTDRVEEINIKLKHQISGKFLYAKLIHPDDRRQNRNWNHENMNIDCRHIVSKGRILNISS